MLVPLVNGLHNSIQTVQFIVFTSIWANKHTKKNEEILLLLSLFCSAGRVNVMGKSETDEKTRTFHASI